MVATVLTACGIETSCYCSHNDLPGLQQCLPLAVLKLTLIYLAERLNTLLLVATVLTACGIETFCDLRLSTGTILGLQQCLPLAVLKRTNDFVIAFSL